MLIPLLIPAVIIGAVAVLAALDLVLPNWRPIVADPTSTHLVSAAIANKIAADVALHAAQAASVAANASLVIDLTASGPAFIADPEHPGSYHVWQADTSAHGGVRSISVVDAAITHVPGPEPAIPPTPPTAADMAALAELTQRIDAIDAPQNP